MKFYTDVSMHFNDVLFTGYHNGNRFRFKTDFCPEFFVPSDDVTGQRTMSGKNVEQMSFNSVKAARKWLREHEDIENFPVYGNKNYIAQFIYDQFPDEIEFDRAEVNVGNIDIEVESDKGFPEPAKADHPVTAITYKCSRSKKYICLGLVDYDQDKALEPQTLYIKCKNEMELLTKFLKMWNEDKFMPDIITGWNIDGFDIPYLVNRIERLFGEGESKRLSPWGIINSREITEFGKVKVQYDIVGIQSLDYLALFKKFGVLQYGTPESFKLDTIANVVLKEKKLSYEEYGSLNKLYIENPQKYIDYNVRDVKLVDRLDEACDYINLAMSIAMRAGTNYVAALGTTQVWDTLIFRRLRRRNVTIPFQKEAEKTDYPGGYVKEPFVGMHDWVVSFDLNSLYPNLIVQYNMSPETLETRGHIGNSIFGLMSVEKALYEEFDVPQNYSVAANGVLFKKEKLGILPEIVKEIYNERKTIKKDMIQKKIRIEKGDDDKEQLEKEVNILHSQQHSIKILLNSLYGALGNRFFRFYDYRVASAVTTSGQLSILWAEKNINEYMNRFLKTDNVDYIIAIDTDSVYINMKKVVDKFVETAYSGKSPGTKKIVAFLDKFCKEKMEPVIEDAYARLAEKMNAYDNRMVMEREVIADRGVWTGKKHYILNVHNSEGVEYEKPKLKVMGIEAVKSSTPQIIRDNMMKTFEIIMEGEEESLHNFVKEFREEFFKLPPEEVAFPRGVNNVSGYCDRDGNYIKGTPINSRAAIMYNKLLKERGVENVYEEIHDGSKMKFLYLKLPNPINENVLGMVNVMPKEFEMDKYFDYNKQFDKAFIKPIEDIVETFGWSTEKKHTLMDHM